jgi:hypothetical protein
MTAAQRPSSWPSKKITSVNHADEVVGVKEISRDNEEVQRQFLPELHLDSVI